MSKEQLDKVLSMLSELTCDELSKVREATYCKQRCVRITCPECGELTTVCGEIDEYQYPSGTIDLVIDDDNDIFYDWDHMDITCGVDCYCASCNKHLGTASDIQKLWDEQNQR